MVDTEILGMRFYSWFCFFCHISIYFLFWLFLLNNFQWVVTDVRELILILLLQLFDQTFNSSIERLKPLFLIELILKRTPDQHLFLLGQFITILINIGFYCFYLLLLLAFGVYGGTWRILRTVFYNTFLHFEDRAIYFR